MPDLSGDSLEKCKTCSNELDRHGNCWSCVEKTAVGAEVALPETLRPDQQMLFDAYKTAESKRISAIMQD